MPGFFFRGAPASFYCLQVPEDAIVIPCKRFRKACFSLFGVSNVFYTKYRNNTTSQNVGAPYICIIGVFHRLATANSF